MIRIFDPISDSSEETHPLLFLVSEPTPGPGLNFSLILADFIARAVCLTLFEFYWANNWGV